MRDLSVEFCGKTFINPFIVAASPSSDGLEKVERAFQAGWGGAVLKTIEPNGKQRRLAEPNMGALEYSGKKQMAFYNYDLCTQLSIEELCEEIRYLKEKYPKHMVIASVMAGNDEEWKSMVQAVEDAGADLIECSVSCPQGDESGEIPASNPILLEKCVKSIKKHIRKNTPVMVKMTPNVTDIVSLAKAVEAGGAESACAIDTVKSFIGVDIETGIPKLNVNGKAALGGLSGPAIKPIALGCVVQIAQNTTLSISGVGGISTYEDALEFMMLGCGVVEICTAISKQGFGMIDTMCKGLEEYMERKNIESLTEIVGMALSNVVSQNELERDWNAVNVTDETRCIRCGKCVVACQDCGFGALNMEVDKTLHIDLKKCVGCGVCKTVCPMNCITIQPME